MLKSVVEGMLVSVTPTHYVTSDGRGITTWNRDYYRLITECQPIVDIKTTKGE
ncbi:hypothetical protein D3C74_50270 [compost metagenome]